MPLCECGCGVPVRTQTVCRDGRRLRVWKLRNRFLWGHHFSLKQKRRAIQIDHWIESQQGKHFCQCQPCLRKGPCKETEISIHRYHHEPCRRIPKYKHNHHFAHFSDEFLPCRKPTTPEFILAQLLPPTVKYVGDGRWWCKVNKSVKNPDFKVVGQDKVIEVFGDYWHRHDDPDKLIVEYRSGGMKCLVIWEREIEKEQHQTVQRCLEFIEK